RNPATIADNVGDNVGDVAGMGADIFESYVGAIVATIAIGATSPDVANRVDAVALPVLYTIAGLVASLVGIAAVRLLERGSPDGAPLPARGAFIAVFAGTLAGVFIGLLTEYYTSGGPIRAIAEASRTGPATNLIAGLAVGMRSTIAPMLMLCAAIYVAYHAAG